MLVTIMKINDILNKKLVNNCFQKITKSNIEMFTIETLPLPP